MIDEMTKETAKFLASEHDYGNLNLNDLKLIIQTIFDELGDDAWIDMGEGRKCPNDELIHKMILVVKRFY